MDDRNVDILDVWLDLVTGVQSLMSPTTAAGTGSGSGLPISNIVTQDATVDFVYVWILTNDVILLWLI